MTKRIDITGQRFGKLVAIEPSHRNQFGAILWRLRCDCGGECFAMAGQLRAGKRQSCSCGLSKPKHGERKTRLYRVWGAMKARCYQPSHPRYARYGGRGISICEDWRQDYAAFANWARANGYAPDLQIDRIDNNGNYEPGNCRFVTPAENMANRECSK